MPSLYVVATPIGNLEDITLRALRVLSEVGLIAAEDTRVTRKLLHRYGIRTRLTSYHQHNRKSKLPILLRSLRIEDIALVCDAGTPGISDTGYELVAAVATAGIPTVSIPGPSAMTSALAVCALPLETAFYVGFLPRRRAARRGLLESLIHQGDVLVAFEAPHRLKATLEDILEVLGDRRISVCRELTKMNEEIFHGTVSDALDHFHEPRGEFTLVIDNGKGNGPTTTEPEALRMLSGLREKGLGARDAVHEAVEKTGLTRRYLYRLWVQTVEHGDETPHRL